MTRAPGIRHALRCCALVCCVLGWGCDGKTKSRAPGLGSDAGQVVAGAGGYAGAVGAGAGAAGSAGIDQPTAGSAGTASQDAGALGSPDAGTSPDAQVTTDAGDAAIIEPPQTLPDSLRNAGVTALYPAPAAVEQCPDPSLHIIFTGPPTLGNHGVISVIDAASGTTAASIDLAVAQTSQAIDGASYVTERAAYVEGNELVLYPQPRLLMRGHAYRVHVAAGAIMGPGGAPLAIDDDTTWTFTTKSSAPSDLSLLQVSSHGNAEFCTPQAALDATSATSSTPTVIELARGIYHGIVHAHGRTQLTLRGADRHQTILAGTNNEHLNGGTAKRALIGIDGSTEVSFEQLTIQNRTPQGGSQAEALRLQTCDRCRVRDADILSLQATLLWSGRLYAEDSLIAGNVDFIWGTGTAYFKNCEIKTVGSKGYLVQARNGASTYGYTFVGCKLTSDPGANGSYLARIDASAYPASHVAYVDCELGPHIIAAGWLITGVASAQLRFWEYGSHTPSGAMVDTSARTLPARQLSSTEAEAMRDPSKVLGGWAP